jgi:hypothetical protein
MTDSIEKSATNSNDYKFNESIKNAFVFKKEELSKLFEEQLPKKTIIKEIVIEALAELDGIYDSFVLSYNDTNIQIHEKNIVKDILNSYLIELKKIQDNLNSIFPSKGLQSMKLQEEMARIEKIIDWNKRKF